MCYKIESSFMMIHTLKGKESCTITELVHKKQLIEKAIPSIYVDVSRQSILNSITCFPEIFYWDNNLVKRQQSSEDYFKDPLIDFFDKNIEMSVKLKITSFF